MGPAVWRCGAGVGGVVGLFRLNLGYDLMNETKKLLPNNVGNQWVSKDIPIGANPPWRGQSVKVDVSNPNLEEGQKIYTQLCAVCHGANGEGGSGPAVWGPNSFNDGAGMATLSKMAAL